MLTATKPEFGWLNRLSPSLSSTSEDTSTTQSNNSDDGVYVSLDQLIDLKNQVIAFSKSSSHRLHNGQPGETLSTLKGQGIEFEDIRPYLPGDDLRHVDWRVVARTGMPHTRRYSEDRERASMIVVDQRATMFFGSGAEFKSYAAAITAAKVAWSAVFSGHRLGGIVASETIDTTRLGNPHRASLTFLNQLVKHNNSLASGAQIRHTLENLLDQLTDSIQPGLIVTIVSDFHDLNPRSAATLAACANRCEVNLIRISDPLEQEINLRGQVGISNGIKVALAKLDSRVQDKYRKQRAMVKLRLEDTAQRSGITLTNIDTRESV